jgi:hypothetical protein
MATKMPGTHHSSTFRNNDFANPAILPLKGLCES